MNKKYEDTVIERASYDKAFVAAILKENRNLVRQIEVANNNLKKREVSYTNKLTTACLAFALGVCAGVVLHSTYIECVVLPVGVGECFGG